MAHPFEAEDMFIVGAPHKYVMFQDKCIDPLYECLPDYDAVMIILKGRGFNLDFSQEEWYTGLLDHDFNKATGLSYSTLKEKKIMSILPDAMTNEQGNYVIGTGGFYYTPSGRAEFYLEDPQPRAATDHTIDQDIERLPRWEPPLEVWSESDAGAKYPLTYFQMHLKWRAHTQFAASQWLRELDPEPLVYLNSLDAEARLIQEGDIVRVFNDRGDVIIKARLDESMRPGTCCIPKGWRTCSYIAGHYNNLTTDVYHPFIVGNIFTDARVEVEKHV
jgi:molybdopterin-containing oxidoreductase family molybdopterin binding subunit